MRGLAAVLATIFVLSGCGLSAAQRVQQAFRQANSIRVECRQRHLAGELKSYVERVRCGNDRVGQAIAESGYPYMDLVNLEIAYRMAVAHRLDKGELSEAEANLQLAELQTRLGSEQQRRDMAAYQTQLQAKQTATQQWQAWNQWQQNERIIRSLQTPRTMAPITCYKYGNMIQCQ